MPTADRVIPLLAAAVLLASASAAQANCKLLFDAMEKLAARKTKVQSWYLDVSMLKQYWGQERVYHHTAPINMLYALRESLAMVLEEGLEKRFQRHREAHEQLRHPCETSPRTTSVRWRRRHARRRCR